MFTLRVLDCHVWVVVVVLGFCLRWVLGRRVSGLVGWLGVFCANLRGWWVLLLVVSGAIFDLSVVFLVSCEFWFVVDSML